MPRELGIEMVYQDLALVDHLDVAANVFLGREVMSPRLGRIGVMNQRQMEEETRRLLDRLKIDISSVRLGVQKIVRRPTPDGSDSQGNGVRRQGHHHG